MRKYLSALTGLVSTMAATGHAYAYEGLRNPAAEWEELWDTVMFDITIIGVIIFNAIILGLETSPALMASYGPLILFLDTLCLSVFVVEILLKLYAHRMAFFRNGWNLFDFVVVIMSVLGKVKSYRTTLS